MTALRVGSLFSGIGGLELGLERAGMTTVFQVEIDPYARRVLAKHWPHIPRFDDVRSVGAHNLPPCDVLAGGFPCQDISVAGLRAGIEEGARSGLWREFVRLIRCLQPRYVLVENVGALFRPHRDEDGAVVAPAPAARVLGDLAACGYDAEWDCLPAFAAGAPHRRDRAFLVAYPNGAGLEGLWTERELGVCADALKTPGRSWWASEPRIPRVDDGVSNRVDRVRALGNAVVPQVAEFLGRRIVAHWEATHAP